MRTIGMLVGGWGLVACSTETEIRRILSPPEARIEVPKPDGVLRIGEDEPVLRGTVFDDFDGPEQLVATWFVDEVATEVDVEADGRVSIVFDPQELGLGAHETRLEVVDSDNMMAVAEVTWTLLGAFEPPLVTITAPSNGLRAGLTDEITFRGQATDNNTPAADLTFTWRSSLDGALEGAITGDGQSVLFTTLTKGLHVVTLEVVDVDELVGTDAVELTIEEKLPEPVDAKVGDIVFSEILVNPEVVDDVLGEWIELYNTSGSPIDLQGYVLSDLGVDRYVISESVLVPPGGYAVICADTDLALNGGIPCDADFVRSEFGGPDSLAFANTTDEVLLSRPDGLLIDQVIYTSSWFEAAVAKGVDPTVLDASNNDDESQWCDQTTIIATATEPGTPGFENDPCD